MLFLKPGETAEVSVGYSESIPGPGSTIWTITGANSAQAGDGHTNNGFTVWFSLGELFATITAEGSVNPGACNLSIDAFPPAARFAGAFQVNGPSSKGPTPLPCKTAPKGDQAPDCGCKGEGKVLAY